ncbi:alpha-N-acetylgalactosaminide alpha-2,6-sialyltransferase 3-like isoform X2 [Stegostoma tigrinum]|uniref:alpha-N-acetylgalactosaminide alpha-2,6-sialyltransferase 3-like isoform X2 n=1 Tax=Stegostoma tigrinum TaxID=3053191 RepID=UPI0028707BA9|nr:alpha-N-acetylgalactosaminide alpha-2,6-sialyltransferase 3-like isoform X2 [Stegostoma tigrinum]
MVYAQKKLNILVAVALIGGLTFIIAVVHYIHQSPYPIILSPLAGELGSRQNHLIGVYAQDAKVLHGYVSLREQQPLTLSCDQCSIVSSSGQMLGKGLGPDIDSSECVWRMNNAPTEGYEADVGSVTTVRVVSHTSTPWLLRQNTFRSHLNNSIYIFWGPHRNMRRDGKGMVYNMLRTVQNRFPSAKLYTVTEEQMRYCDMAFKKETGKDSTGWFTFIVAMEACRSIHVFGMINASFCSTEGHRNVPYHYYEPSGQEECAEYYLHENAQYGGHRFITEKGVFAKWAKERKIKFFNPTWQIS